MILLDRTEGSQREKGRPLLAERLIVPLNSKYLVGDGSMNQKSAILLTAVLVLGLVVGTELGTQLPTARRQQFNTTTQVVVKGQTWDYFAFYGSSLSSPPESVSPGDSFAVVNSDSIWTSDKGFPELFLSPGQSKTYQVRLFIDPRVLGITGQLLSIDGFGLGVHFSTPSVDGSAGGGTFTMTVSLAANFSSAVNIFQIPVVFSSTNRIQPVSFGPILLISGFPSQSITGDIESGQPAFSFQDDQGRGYAVDLITYLRNTSMIPSPFVPPSSRLGPVCASLDPNGVLHVTHDGNDYPCPGSGGTQSVSLALKPGQTTDFVLALKLTSQLGVQLGFSNQVYSQSPSSAFALGFSPSIVILHPGQEVNVTVTVRALKPGSSGVGIAVTAVTLDGYTVGIGPVHIIGFDVNVIG
jgi:hypothetical protein